MALQKAARKVKDPEIVWEIDSPAAATPEVVAEAAPEAVRPEPGKPLRAAE
jgi:hypothetical protein